MKLTPREKIGACVAALVLVVGSSIAVSLPANASGSCGPSRCGQLVNYGSVRILTNAGINEYIYPGQRTQSYLDYDSYYVPANKCYTISVRGAVNAKCGYSTGRWYAIGNTDWVQAYPR